MKNLLKIFLLGALAFAATSTSAHDFHVKRGEIFYQKVFEGTPPAVMPFKIESQNDSIITGHFLYYRIKERITEENKKFTNIFMPYTDPMRGNVSVEIRKNRYRVTITEIDFRKKDEFIMLDYYLILNGKMNQHPDWPPMLEAMSREFEIIFTRQNETW